MLSILNEFKLQKKQQNCMIKNNCLDKKENRTTTTKQNKQQPSSITLIKKL